MVEPGFESRLSISRTLSFISVPYHSHKNEFHLSLFYLFTIPLSRETEAQFYWNKDIHTFVSHSFAPWFCVFSSRNANKDECQRLPCVLPCAPRDRKAALPPAPSTACSDCVLQCMFLALAFLSQHFGCLLKYISAVITHVGPHLTNKNFHSICLFFLKAHFVLSTERRSITISFTSHNISLYYR